ncbi:MAG: hypothetical protein H0W12_06145 [Chitinophagaceae bacterium]|nr:hypothetical protein [Chitinophagaceae bacterium]
MKHTIFIFFSLLFLQSKAQTPDVLLGKFNLAAPQEKIHIHFDKEMYVAGESIWFKAYLTSQFLPSGISSSLFVEFIDSRGKLISKKNLPVFEGTSQGNIELPDSLAGGSYTIRAYTAWMLNFDKEFNFTKKIFVFNNTASLPVAEMKNDSYTFNFFPEGGNMIADVVNYIAYKATDANGYPISFQGSIVDSKGNNIIDIKTVHDGMGRFPFLPQYDEKYFAKVKFDNGKEATMQLPASLLQGIAMHIDKNNTGLRIALTRPSAYAKDKMPLFIVGQMENNVVFKTNITLDGETGNITVPTSTFPSGILQITIFDAEQKPIAERLSFVDNEDYKLNSSFTMAVFNTTKRAKNNFSFAVPDSIEGSYSVAITDEDKVGILPDRNNIISDLLLSADIKGYVHDPAFYFTSNDKFTKDALELVMMTNGWRRFKWEQILASQTPDIKYKPYPYIRFSGKVYEENKTTLVTSGDLNFFVRDKVDSSTIFISAPIDAEGNFKIDSLYFSDTAHVYFDYNTKKKSKKQVFLKLDQTSPWPLRNFLNMPAINYRDDVFSDSMMLKMKRNKDQLTFYNAEMSKYIRLKEIKIKVRQKSPAQLVNERYTSSLFSNENAKIIDLVNNPTPNTTNLETFIRSRIPGVDFLGSPGNQKIVSIFGGRSILKGQQTVTLYLDEFETDFNSISYLLIDEIALIKYVDNFVMVSGNGPAMFIYRKLPEDMGNNASQYVSNFSFPGYSVTKEFYSPDYSMPQKDVASDIRTTLYWNPEILLNKEKQKENFQFYNADNCHKIRVVIEGFNKAGKLCRIEKVIGN